MLENILTALEHIDVATLSYLEWILVGMALKHEGFSCSVWDEWSKNDARYVEGECQSKWETFHGGNNPVTGATIIQMARERGWGSSEDSALGWDATISGISVNDENDGVVPDGKEAVNELITYLETLFDENDIVGYVTKSWTNSKGKQLPTRGTYTRTAGELIASLRKNPDDIAATIGDWNPEAGAWIRVNPLDGKGISNENVTNYHFVLVESDTLPVDEQAKLYQKLNLPIAALVYSGGKSLHAVVHVDAANEDEYTERVDFLYDFLKKHGLEVDPQTKNSSRLSRLPGVTRNGKFQKLITTNVGKRSWNEWMESIQENPIKKNKWPDIVPLSDYAKNPPPLAKEIIKGMLRESHKGRLSAPSKAGKSFLMMELAMALAEGKSWLGFPCVKSRVLYINLEIDGPSAIDRLLKIYKTTDIKSTHMGDLLTWDLRGYASSLEELLPAIIKAVKEFHVDMVIIDPIYKIFGGADENSAAEVAKFCNYLDQLCRETGCAVMYVHHQSKGSQSGKTSMDRASGSGVFSRDPDCILDVAPLRVPPELREKGYKGSAWRMECTLREFPDVPPVNFWFEYPVHILDTEGVLKNCRLGYGAQEENRKSKLQQHRDEIDAAFKKCHNPVTIKEMAEKMGRCDKTVRTYLDEYSDKYWHDSCSVELNDQDWED